MKDLFIHYEDLPQVVLDLVINEGDVDGYEGCAKLLAKVKALGYTFEYGLDAEPFNLTKIIKKDDFDDVVKDDDESEHEWAHICVEHAEVAESQGAMIADGGGATCGIEGCANESLHYIDF